MVMSRRGFATAHDPDAGPGRLLRRAAGLSRELGALSGEVVDARYAGAFLAPLLINHTKCRDLVSEALAQQGR
ncbi:hypothetical protein D9753_18415 [Streptomyces dangxiongensis]|uniref:Uncharacterized protein n=1 Tax=Streptomyces dangxiongensis TaxID=1442032 RepID=A0A3G2JDZ9_9ACTN|nr:hypothetical protein [Streptomyces dangxiongensis]AYN40550.1 hypothetical protein D9753_18415 [Streptomyces dangxiongensis]